MLRTCRKSGWSPESIFASADQLVRASLVRIRAVSIPSRHGVRRLLPTWAWISSSIHFVSEDELERNVDQVFHLLYCCGALGAVGLYESSMSGMKSRCNRPIRFASAPDQFRRKPVLCMRLQRGALLTGCNCPNTSISDKCVMHIG